MRRLLATLLLTIFSYSLISPALFASDADSKLPACCRRNGAHRCAMSMNQSGQSSGPVRAGRCPSFPECARAVPASRTVGLPEVFSSDICRDRQSSRFPPADRSAVPNLVQPRWPKTRASRPSFLKLQIFLGAGSDARPFILRQCTRACALTWRRILISRRRTRSCEK